ncbi:ATP-dependent RecD-like DNA helicase [Marinomonas gallaica]|uniref:ATP-dependent RecD-like DNA helicase n=1 Tax=Marinomonas gallaica TaxID=1806667 RepID=A0A1C3JTI5_9GAMM|nr:AAA domain-containing protein [Marinomonas gallaica]SBT18544.1 ATP-dependent RecD-like DNA helicase [Marinomonas gallaica]SBT22747.1 ATP-dependent RecD-like DNA helicase [Marinomonas gallaica]
MENPFFTALEQQGSNAATLSSQTNSVLVPFMHYLNNSIKALENKEVSCEWKLVANKRYQIKPDKRIWQLLPVSEIEVVAGKQGWFEILTVDGELPDADFDPDESDPIQQGKGKGRRETDIPDGGYNTSEHQLYLPELELGDDQISWSGYRLKLRPLAIQLDQLESVYIDGQPCKVTKQTDARLVLQGHVKASSTLSISGQDTPFTLIKGLDESQLKQWQAKSEGNGWLLFADSPPQVDGHKLEDVTSKQLAKLSCGYFQCQDQSLQSDHWELRVEVSKQAQSLILESRTNQEFNDSDSLTCSVFPALTWQLEKARVEEKWIQLIENEGGDDTGKSDLDYFFGDNQNIKILDSTQRKFDDGFRVLKARQDERQILLARNIKGKKNWSSDYPSQQGKSCEIRVSVDTSQLKRQKDAINQLMSRPARGHWPLVQMLQKRGQTSWPDVPVVQIPESGWTVLTDPNFDGCDRQREFVTKALANEDFTILDGPPGTGKTTTILELIMQLVLQGKRVLLSASTHAAINNVLERIKETPALSAQIFPLRIGDENNAIGVEEFQFDKLFYNLKKENGCEHLSKQLMVDSSNLVCGTTIGILRLFNDREMSLDIGEPPFDVMIIDECSKTTFQEFLVPARFAKRWVLVGDVRQLSPFTDREQIVANLDNLMLVPPKDKKPGQNLPAAVQQACFLLEELRGDHRNPYSHPVLVPVTRDVASALVAEIRTRTSLPKLAKGLDNLLVLTANAGRDAYSHQLGLKQIQQKPDQLYRHSLCFVEEGCLGELKGWIPDDMLILHPDWCRTSQAAQHKVSGTGCKSFKVKTSEYTDTVHVHKELLDRIDSTKWSEEVCWRLEREYWLRLSANQKQKTDYLEDTLDRLFPKSVSADGRIHVLKNIAFPSILEALSGDGLVKRKSDEPTTLNQGFDASEKPRRYTTLTYQHRMHPDISAFPRQQFYPQGVLKDGGKTASGRAWQYTRYESRNTWLDVRGTTLRGNSNKQETQALITELKAFCDWADGKNKNNKGEAFDVAILTFYKGQEKALREALQKLPGNANRYARFNYKGISIKLATVDYFQGQEADVVFLSMVNTYRDGFMDSPNRLNVSITRARYQLVIVGHHEYFSQRCRTLDLKKLAESCHVSTENSQKKLHHNAGKKGKSRS